MFGVKPMVQIKQEY